ncbi:zinc finger protein 160 [Danaus plexippus plexippus]|uniref:Zinc finger protein 160 n=1 Tax=Danaus plexippus plexippus TaxID=278856 RepID=A0A212F479_DANPL|nr:zinc finger protein 160 [Danaus plexippus plexippus]
MDENTEMKLKTICCACLSVDRKLTKLCRVEDGVNSLFFLLSYNCEVFEEIFNKRASLLSICWECKAIIYRLQQFRKQVSLAQKQLSELTDGRDLKNFHSLSKLQYSHQDKYNFIIENISKPDNFIDCGPDISFLKTESDTDDIPLADLYLNNCKDIQPPPNDINIGCIENNTDNKHVGSGCSKYEMTEEEMWESMKTQKENEFYMNSSSKCESCVRVFNDYKCLERHNLKLHRPNHIQCGICKVYVKRRGFKQHKQSHYTKHVCDICRFVAYKIVTMNTHLRNEHGVDVEYKKVRRKPNESKTSDKQTGGFLCTECDKWFENKNKRYKHTQKCHRDGFKCGSCGKRFAFRNTLTRHERVHSSPLPREQCPTCGKLIRQDLIKAHAHTHTHRQTHVCVACDKRFISRASYENHLKYAKSHAVGDVLKYKCPECKKGYRSRGELRDHVNYQHMGRTLHKCPICDKALATRRCITRHVKRAHHGIKENDKDKICQTCGKTFRDNKCLREHELIHTGERPLSCDVCGRTFRQSASLYTHRRRVHHIVAAQRIVVHEEGSEKLKPV